MKLRLLSLTILLVGSINASLAQSPGNALDFDGTNDYVSASLPTVFNDIPNNEFTIEAWIKPESSNFCRVVFAQLNPTNFASLSLSNTNQIYFYISNTVGVNTTATIPTGAWSHVACTWAGPTAEALVYINGNLVSTVSGGTSSTGNDNILTIGARTNAAQFFTGELDEVRIWDDKRTACEISVSSNSDFTTTQPNLVAYYDFNQGTPSGTNTTITTLTDLTTNHDGTLNSFALSGASSNWVTSGANINSTDQNGNTYNTTDVINSCGSYVWIDGNTYSTSNNSATHTVTSVSGCDSIVSLDLTVLNSATGTDTRTECDSYTWIDGVNYTSSNNTATYNLVGAAANGCDSLVTLDLTINSVSDLTTSLNGATISANNTLASYSWLDCDDNYAVIPSETNQTFTPASNGNYAVQITENGCVDTSSCVAVTTVGVIENTFGDNLLIFPNPTNGNFSIDLGAIYENVEIAISDVNGKLIRSESFKHEQVLNLTIDELPGIYLIAVQANDRKTVIRLVKN